MEGGGINRYKRLDTRSISFLREQVVFLKKLQFESLEEENLLKEYVCLNSSDE